MSLGIVDGWAEGDNARRVDALVAAVIMRFDMVYIYGRCHAGLLKQIPDII